MMKHFYNWGKKKLERIDFNSPDKPKGKSIMGMASGWAAKAHDKYIRLHRKGKKP